MNVSSHSNGNTYNILTLLEFIEPWSTDARGRPWQSLVGKGFQNLNGQQISTHNMPLTTVLHAHPGESFQL